MRDLFSPRISSTFRVNRMMIAATTRKLQKKRPIIRWSRARSSFMYMDLKIIMT